MSRIHGRSGALYANLTSGGTPEPLAYISNWSLDFGTDTTDVTAMQDTNKIKLAGLPNAAGTFAGWYDNATVQTYTAAIDGVARKFYLYPNTTQPTQYFFGTAVFDFSINAGVDGGVAMSGDFEASTLVAKQG